MDNEVVLPEVAEDNVLHVINEIKLRMSNEYKKKSRSRFYSEYEVLGKLAEEQHEFLEAIHQRKTLEEKQGELYDIAIVAIHALASYEVGMKQRRMKK